MRGSLICLSTIPKTGHMPLPNRIQHDTHIHGIVVSIGFS